MKETVTSLVAIGEAECAKCGGTAYLYSPRRFVTKKGEQYCSACFMDYAVTVSGGRG